MKLRIKGRKLWSKGVKYDIDVEDFRTGDGEASTAGYIEKDDRRIVVDRNHQDDATLSHEVGHAICDQAGIYLSEYQMVVFEDLFALCRDPRNFWFLEHLAGSRLNKSEG